MTRAKVYDYDRNWDTSDGIDGDGRYIIREVDSIDDLGRARLKNGLISLYYRLMEDRTA